MAARAEKNPDANNQPGQSATAAGNAPPAAQTGTLSVFTFDYRHPSGEGAYDAGKHAPLPTAEVAVYGSDNAVAADPVRGPNEALSWRLQPGLYRIEPRPHARYTLPTRYHAFVDKAPVERNCAEPVEVKPDLETQVILGYRPEGVPDPPYSPTLEQLQAFSSALAGIAADYLKSPAQYRGAAQNADLTPCCASMCIRLFEAPDVGHSGDCNAGYPGVANAKVTLTATGTKVPFCDSRETDDSGLVCFNDLPAGAFQLTVDSPRGYTLGSTFSVSSGSGPASPQPTDTPIEILEGGEVAVCGGLIATPAHLVVNAVLDDDRCGDPSRHALIGNVQVDVYRGDTHLGCLHTRDTDTSVPGVNTLDVTAGLVSLVARPSIDVDGRQLRLASSAPLMVRLGPGETRSVYMRYVPGLAEINLTARLLSGPPNQRATRLLPGVKLALYRGPLVVGDPIRTLSTRGDAATVFSGLDEGVYTIVASGPATFAGQTIGVTQPRGSVVQVIVGSGEVMPLGDAFTFEPVLARVVLSAIDKEHNAGLEGVAFVLSKVMPAINGRTNGHDSATDLPLSATTDAAGDAILEDVPPGDWTVALVQDPVTLIDETQWVLDDASTALLASPLHVTTGTARLELRLVRDIHRIFGPVTTPGGAPLAYAVVLIQDEQGANLATVTADQGGHYEWIAPRAGTYYLVVQDTVSGATMRRFPAAVAQPIYMPLIGHGWLAKNVFGDAGTGTGDLSDNGGSGGGGGGSGGNGGGSGSNGTNGSTSGVTGAQFAESAIDLTAYPILTEEVSFPMTARPAPSGSSAPGGAPLSQIVETAVRDVLNWRPKANDPAGFSSALAQAFALKEVEGHTQWTWTPRSYTVQTDLGAVTGAQASLYTRAKVALDQSLPLLDGLTSLNEVLQEDLESIKVVVRSSLIQLVNEFGLLGGPRVKRVNELFALLLGTPFPTDPEKVQGQLLILKQRFGLDRKRINTVADEQNFTNFLILTDNIIGLSATWVGQQPYFDGTADEPYMGTQLVLLSRDLEVVCELVRATYFAMDSVFLGPAQRQTIELEFGLNQRMFLADLLDWVDRVASEEGPRLFQNAGKDGIAAFRSTIADLEDLVRRSLLTGNGGVQVINGTLPAAYGSPRVQRALQALAKQLAETKDDVGKILPPVIGDAEMVSVLSPDQLQVLADQVAARITKGLALQQGNHS